MRCHCQPTDKDVDMSTPFFALTNFEALNRYRITLQLAKETTDRVKQELGLTSNQAFVQLHQPSLDMTLIQVRGRLQSWPELFEWPNRIFYQQSDLVGDIRRLDAEYSRVLDGMNTAERGGFLSALDFSRAPFELNGRMKVLSVGPGFSFAQQVKQHVLNLNNQYNSAAFTCSNVYQNSSLILPRLINFMQVAIETYAKERNVDPLGNDARIVTVRALIEQMKDEQRLLADASRDLSEGYSNLERLVSGALDEFKDLFTSITLQRFHEMIESALVRLELAEELIEQTRR